MFINEFVMKRYIAFVFFVVATLHIVNGQTYKDYDHELFHFRYPDSYKSEPIKSSPGMILKMASGDNFLSVSIRETGWDESISIWDDRIFERLSNNHSGSDRIVSMSKEMINLKDESRRCIKIMSNLRKQKQGVNIDIKILSYMMLHKGKLFIIGFTAPGKYTKASSTSYSEKIMRGFMFKSTNREVDFDSHLLDVVKKLNAQCPMQIDPCTTYLQVLLSGNTVMIKTLIEDVCDTLVDFDEFRNKMCENFSVALDKPFVQYLDRNGYSIMYMIYNENDRLKSKVKISGQDILNYYH